MVKIIQAFDELALTLRNQPWPWVANKPNGISSLPESLISAATCTAYISFVSSLFKCNCIQSSDTSCPIAE